MRRETGLRLGGVDPRLALSGIACAAEARAKRQLIASSEG